MEARSSPRARRAGRLRDTPASGDQPCGGTEAGGQGL
jgi:hypothetical protein